MSTVLIIGSTGQVGRVVAEEAIKRGLTVRAQTRSVVKARGSLPEGVEIAGARLVRLSGTGRSAHRPAPGRPCHGPARRRPASHRPSPPEWHHQPLRSPSHGGDLQHCRRSRDGLRVPFRRHPFDEVGALDGVLDTNNVPLNEEPERVRDDIARFSR